MTKRNADVSKTLTDKWKKGELPDGFYWIEFQDGEIASTTFSNLHGFICCDSWCYNEKIKQSLKEMPSYEQWVMTKNLSERAHLEMYKARGEKVRLEKENAKLKTENKWYSEQLNEAVKEVGQLKELLKELKRYFDKGGKYYIEKRILLEINQVLGEE